MKAFASFTVEEHRRRLEGARDLLAADGVDYCISVAPESLYYYGGYDSWVSVNSPQALIFATAGGEPTIVLRDTDIPLAAETTWVGDVRSYRLLSDDVPTLFATVAREKGLRGGKVAIETQSYAFPHALGLALARALEPAEIVDATKLLGLPRLIKSDTEMTYVRKAAQFAQIGLEMARRTVRPGINEIDLAAAVEGAMRSAGSDYWSIPTELASGNRSAGGHATARERVIEPGDLVHLEFAGVSRRYHAAAIHTVSAGEPSRRGREIYDIGRASLVEGLKAIRPGVRVADVEEASLGPVLAAGLEHAAVMRFGYGIGIAYPPIWLEPLQISRGSDQVLEPGMVFVLHAYLQLVEEQLGTIQGGTYALTAQGLEVLVGAGDVALEVY